MNSGNNQQLSHVAAAVAEVQGAMFLARQYPRDQRRAFNVMLNLCESFDFAIDSLYVFPRGSSLVQGLTVVFARAAVQEYGNMFSGWEQTGETDDTLTVQGFCWDLETNSRKVYKVTTGRMVQRKIYDRGKYKETVWEPADERQSREIVAKAGAVVERNAILNSLPLQFVEGCKTVVKTTVSAKASTPAEIEKTVNAFRTLGVNELDLEGFLGKPLKKIPKGSLVWGDLRAIYKTIKDQQATWADYAATGYARQVEQGAAETEPPPPPQQSDQGPGPTQSTTTEPETQPAQTGPQPDVSQAPEAPKGLTKDAFTPDEWSILSRNMWVGQKVPPAMVEQWIADSWRDGTKAELMAAAQAAADAKERKK